MQSEFERDHSQDRAGLSQYFGADFETDSLEEEHAALPSDEDALVFSAFVLQV